MQTVLRKRVSHQAEKEAPGENTQYMVIALNHITCPKVSPMATGLQNHNYWRFMLAVVALLSGFTFSPLEECIRCIVLTQGDLSEFTASCVLPGGVVFPIACSEHKQQSKKENFFWIIELLPSGNTLSLWFWVCLVINKDIWEVLFARHQEFGIQGWDVDISPFKGWIELIHLSTQVAEHLLCAG